MKRKQFMLASLLLVNGCAASPTPNTQASWAARLTFFRKASAQQTLSLKSCKPITISDDDKTMETMQPCPGKVRESMNSGLAGETPSPRPN